MNAEGNNHSGLKKKFVKSPNHINFHLHTHTILFKMDRKKNETGPANKTQAHKLVCLYGSQGLRTHLDQALYN